MKKVLVLSALFLFVFTGTTAVAVTFGLWDNPAGGSGLRQERKSINVAKHTKLTATNHGDTNSLTENESGQPKRVQPVANGKVEDTRDIPAGAPHPPSTENIAMNDHADTSIGIQALQPADNTARDAVIGFPALNPSTTGGGNPADGWAALHGDTTGYQDIACGAGALNAMLLNEVQKQQKRITALEEQSRELTALRQQNIEQERRIGALEEQNKKLSALADQVKDLSAIVAEDLRTAAYLSDQKPAIAGSSFKSRNTSEPVKEVLNREN